MIDIIMSLPTILSAPLMTLLIASFGMGTYFLAYKLSAEYRTKETREATLTIFNVVGVLLSLFLSLTFADVMIELNSIENAIEKEATALSDIHNDLRRFDSDETKDMQELIVDYTQAIIDDDWPALADDGLGDQAGALLRKLEDSALKLHIDNEMQETLRSRIIADVDLLPDYRLSRLGAAFAKPPFYLVVVLFAYLFTMLRLALYPQSRAVVTIAALYVLLIGMIVFLIHAFSDPFHGATGVDPAPLEYLLEKLQER